MQTGIADKTSKLKFKSKATDDLMIYDVYYSIAPFHLMHAFFGATLGNQFVNLLNGQGN